MNNNLYNILFYKFKSIQNKTQYCLWLYKCSIVKNIKNFHQNENHQIQITEHLRGEMEGSKIREG